jgi:glycosyltransferase involved in cell wall biosynthesis
VKPAPELSVVIPCLNERENLEPLVNAIRATLDALKLSYEVVLADDCSTDGSWEFIGQLSASDPKIRARRLASTSGQSAAMWVGIQAARGKVIVTMDADLQNPPSEIPKFLEALKEADCVCGSRIASRRRGDSLVRMMCSKIANSIRNMVLRETVSDSGCCFRAFRSECIQRIRFFRGAHRFLPALMNMEGFTVTEIAVDHRPRHAGRTHYGIWNRLLESPADLMAVRWMKKRTKRYDIAETLD